MKNKFPRELKRFFKTGGSRGNRYSAPWYVPKVPSVITMFLRCMILSIITIAFWGIATIAILGEDVFWSFNLVDTLNKNAGIVPGDIYTAVVVWGWLAIWAFGVLWVPGFIDRWF